MMPQRGDDETPTGNHRGERAAFEQADQLPVASLARILPIASSPSPASRSDRTSSSFTMSASAYSRYPLAERPDGGTTPSSA